MIDWKRLIKVSDEETVNVIAGKQILLVRTIGGRSIVDIEKTGTAGLVDTYTIYYNDGTTSTFQVTNGSGGIESVVLVKDNDYEIVYNINAQTETYPLTISKMIDANVDSVYSRFAVKDSSNPRKEFHYFKASAEEHALGELDLVVNFPVTQLGSGTPSLTNIRPFYHVSEFEMFSSNKINLLSGVDKSGGQTPFTIAVLNNKTVRITASSGAQEYYKADAFRYKMVLPAGEYAFSGGSYIPTGTSTVYASARIIDAGADSLLATDTGDGCTFILYEDTLIHVLIDLGYSGATEVYTNFVLSPYLRNTNSSDEYSAPMGTYYKGDIAASGTEFWAYGGLYGGYIDIVGQKIYKTWDYIMSFDPETDTDKLVGVWYSDRDEYGPGRIPTEGAEVVYCMEEPEVIGGIWGSLSCWINAQTSFCFRFAGAHGAFPAESYLSRRIVPMTLRQFIEMHKDIEISSVEQTKDNDYRESYKISESNGDSFDFDVSKMIDVNEDSPYDREGLWQASPWAQFYYCKVRSDGAGTLGEGDMIIKVPVHQAYYAAQGIRPFTGLTGIEFFHSHVINLLSGVDASGLPSAWSIGTGSNGGFIVTYSGAVPSNTRLDAFRYKMVLPAGEYKLSGGAYHNEWATPTVFLKNRVYDAIRDEVLATDEGDGCEFALYEDTLIIVKVDFYEASSSGFPYGTVFYPFLRKTTSGDTYAAPKGEYIKSSEISGGFYGGYIDLATGWMYREYGHIASYTEADASKLVGVWYSDRDTYEKGKLPTVGAEVVYHLEEPQADILGGFYGRDPMQLTDGETNFFGFQFQYGQYGVCDIEIAKRRIIPMTLRQYIQTHITQDVADFLYAPRKHTHDDRYYKKSYLDMALSGKADAITKTGTMEDSGNPIVLPAGVTVTGAKLKFTLTQTGSGTPSSSNIRPFLYALNLEFYVNDEDGEHLENMEYWLPYISPTQPVMLVDGEYDLIAGTLTTEYMAIQNWDGSTPIEEPWWSDRDEYASGTLPSVGAFVVYKLSEPQTYTAVAGPELAQLWNQITEWEVIPKQRTADVDGFGEVEIGYSGQIQVPLESYIEGITAEGFSATKAYAVGDYVIYDGGLYRFTSAHTAGAWNANEVTQTTIMDEIKRALS